jgi:hypothetical protein
LALDRTAAEIHVAIDSFLATTCSFLFLFRFTSLLTGEKTSIAQDLQKRRGCSHAGANKCSSFAFA